MEVSRKPDNSEEVVMTACRSHCGGACLLKLHVKGGVISRIETDDESKACLRGRAYRQRVYAPDRLKYPLKRVGERGKGEFERVSWSEALDTVASELKRVRADYEPSAVLLLYSAGDGGWLHNAGLMENLLARSGGYSGTWGSASCEGATFAAMMSYGVRSQSHTHDDLLNSRLIILWGWNPSATNNFDNTSLSLVQAREAGARVVTIDPRYTDSAAAFAHQWIPIIPNSDAAMVIAMAYVIITENLQDQAFLDKYTVGFDRYKEYVLGKEDGVPKTPAWAERITGVAAATIVNLAREYATNKPAALIDGHAPGRTACGEEFHRTTIALAAMTGNIGVHGGSAPGDGTQGHSNPFLKLGPFVYARMKGGDNPVDQQAPPRKDALWYNKLGKGIYYFGGPSSARVNRHYIADAILKGRRGGYPADYKLLYLMNCNYVNQYANINKIIQALKKLEFIVVQEQFMTATAKFADIVLPTNTCMERNDLLVGGVGLFYGYMNKAIDSLAESKSHFEIATELAARLGIADYTDKTEEEWLRTIVEECKDISDYDTFKKQGAHRVKLAEPFVCFEKQISDPSNNPFNTPSGKIEIYSQEIADLGNNPMLPSIPKYIEAWEGPNDPLVEKYPLQLITSHERRRAHSQFDNIPWLREFYPQAIAISGVDARLRGIKDGDMVKVFNDRGAMVIPANVTERIMPGVVDIPQGAWYDPDKHDVDRGGCANVLTKDGASPGAAFPSNTSLVQVEKA